MSPRASKRDDLLRSATALVAEHGYSALTLDAVGARSGVSKGGVLYHFRTKEALVAGLLERLVTDFEVEQQAAYDADPTTPGAWTRAYVAASDAPPPVDDAQPASAAILAAVGHDPSLLEPLQDRYRTWVARLETDDLPGVDAHVVRLAADGLWAADLFGLAPPTPALRARIRARLDELAGAGDGPRP